MKLRKGQVAKCRECGLTLDRQLCGAINIYFKMKGFPSSPSHLLPRGDKAYDPSMEDADEERKRGCPDRE